MQDFLRKVLFACEPILKRQSQSFTAAAKHKKITLNKKIMKDRQPLTLVTLALAMLAPAPFARAQTTAFTYQGQLLDGTNAATGLYTMTFALYDSATGGSTVATGVVANNVPVTNGLFTVNLDFGSTPFNGSARWLEIGVRTSNSYEVLSPRTVLSPTRYAIYAQSAG